MIEVEGMRVFAIWLYGIFSGGVLTTLWFKRWSKFLQEQTK